jgi:hypothetical protein
MNINNVKVTEVAFNDKKIGKGYSLKPYKRMTLSSKHLNNVLSLKGID